MTCLLIREGETEPHKEYSFAPLPHVGGKISLGKAWPYEVTKVKHSPVEVGSTSSVPTITVTKVEP